MKRLWILCCAIAMFAMNVPARAADEFLDPEVAFKLSARAADAQRVEIRFDIAPGYYLYAEKFNAEVLPGTVRLAELQVPKGKRKFDETFQKEVEYFRDSATLLARLDQAPACLNVLNFRDPVRARLMLFNDTSHYSDRPRTADRNLSKWWDEKRTP